VKDSVLEFKRMDRTGLQKQALELKYKGKRHRMMQNKMLQPGTKRHWEEGKS
jgi:hypothetical protein